MIMLALMFTWLLAWCSMPNFSANQPEEKTQAQKEYKTPIATTKLKENPQEESVSPQQEKKTISFEQICAMQENQEYPCPDPTRMEHCLKKDATIVYSQYSPNIEQRCSDDWIFTDWKVYAYTCEDKQITELFDGDNDTKALREKNKFLLGHMGCGADVLEYNEDYLLFSWHPYEWPYCWSHEKYFLFERTTWMLHPLPIIWYRLGQGLDKPELVFTGFQNSEIIKTKIETIGEKYKSLAFWCISYNVNIVNFDINTGNTEFSIVFSSSTWTETVSFSWNIYQRIVYTPKIL